MANTIIKKITAGAMAMVVALALVGCSTQKLVPQDHYLLDKVKLTSDSKELAASKLEPYVRQRPNSKWFSLVKVPLAAYAMAGNDSTKWINRKLREMGEQPMLFDTLLTERTCQDLNQVMVNMGYLRSTVDYETTVGKRKKLNVTYHLHPGERYSVRTVHHDIQDEGVAEVLRMSGTRNTLLKEGKPFAIADLNDERKRITTLLNEKGYYNFHKDFITFDADTVEGSTKVDLTMVLHPFRTAGNRNAVESPHVRYKIGRVDYHAAGDENHIPLRMSVLRENTLIEPDNYFNSADLQKTYNKFSRLQVVKYTNIRFAEVPGTDTLNCDISLSTNKKNSVMFQPEGTNTAGDLGAAASLTYENRNVFNGAETFSIKLRAAFEAITGLEGYQNQDYEEYNVEGKLSFPRFVVPFLSRRYRKQSMAFSELSVSYNMQNRPEFSRRVFSAGWRYRWNDISRRRQYKFDLIDLNYIYMPWISPTFKSEYLDDASSRNSILRYNYEDLFIMKMGFGFSHTNKTEAYKLNVETAGNLLRAMSKVLGGTPNADGQYTLFNIAYAQYVKVDFDYTKLFAIDHRNNLALHVGVGVACPYGNSNILPFEKRYFSGGANSVRGWSVRGLGPGKFKGNNGSIDFINQTGDVKLDFNLELRSYLFWKLYGAAFVDAGNIWTLRSYEEQPGGQFLVDEFYKQIAVAYGLGLRLNFDYFILRFDMGMKAVNPAYDTQRAHYPLLHPNLGRDFSFHFAVGLPF
ncbi:MAG: BamA/TamA family outer membrane protein [Prevotella sp.]|nr:BamA/TamA family outer membrane protein [Prevotella sp.]